MGLGRLPAPLDEQKIVRRAENQPRNVQFSGPSTGFVVASIYAIRWLRVGCMRKDTPFENWHNACSFCVNRLEMHQLEVLSCWS
jgi:hypothetical protein